MRAFAFIAAFSFAVWLPAQAGTMYKCTEGGRTTFGDRPCNNATGGGRFAVQPPPPPDPAYEARQASARKFAQALDAQQAAQQVREERDMRDAQRRDYQQKQDKLRYCTQLRQRHQVAAENDQRAIGRARGQNRAFQGDRALYREREREREMAEQCPA